MSRKLLALAVLVLAATIVRLHAARIVGFGDSEALYACYALHPQAAYLDHPGLVGVVMGAIGGGAAPTPLHAHLFTTLLLGLSVPLAVWVARVMGASEDAALGVGFVFFVVPEMSVGLFGLTPDALLLPAMLLCFVFAAMGLETEDHPRKPLYFLLAGLFAGVAASAKIPGLLLFPILVATWARSPHRHRAWPWLGLGLGAIVVAPVVAFEAKHGFPMLAHRLVSTQAGAGFSPRNLGAVVLGQLAYLSPVLAILAAAGMGTLWRARKRSPVDRLLFLSFAVQAVPLLVLSLWSKVAEPHWLAPALLAIPFAEARDPSPLVRRLGRAAFGVGLLATATVYAWVLVPGSARLLPASVDAKVDISNELHGWNQALDHARGIALGDRGPGNPEGTDLVLVGPHWTVCAQLHAGLGREFLVGCDTPIRDDFDGWMPREVWKEKEKILFVSDNRFEGSAPPVLPRHVPTLESHVRVMRGGKVARVFTFTLYERRAQAGM